MNAVIHRDYSISDDIQILIFNNRIEVVSPGRLPGYVTPQNILHARYSRNSKIVRTLARYKEPPNRDLGEGLNTAFQKMKDWKLHAPEITEEGNYVRVVIPHTPLATPSEAILEFLKANPTITNRQARDITGIKSENSMKSEFYKLRDEGLLEMIRELKGAAAAWRLTTARKSTTPETMVANRCSFKASSRYKRRGVQGTPSGSRWRHDAGLQSASSASPIAYVRLLPRSPHPQFPRRTPHGAHVLLGRFHRRHATTAHEQVLLEGRRIVIGQGFHNIRLGDLLGVGRAAIGGWSHSPYLTGGTPHFNQTYVAPVLGP